MAATPLTPLIRGEHDQLPLTRGTRSEQASFEGGLQPGSHWGLIQLFTGDGKGKTCAALGVVLRACAIGKRVAIVAFDKGGETHYSERTVIRERLPDVELFVTGRDRIDPATVAFDFGVTDQDRLEGERALAVVRRLFSDAKHDLIVLDEINSSTALGIIKEQDVLSLLDQKPLAVELILTGRNAPPSFLERADLVTEMKKVKHYFDRGCAARQGLDF